MKAIRTSIRTLIADSLDPKSNTSSKRVSLLLSQFLFSFQIFLDIILHAIILIWIQPLPSVEFYQIMASVQGLGLTLNAITIWWHLGAIKNVDVAFAGVLQAKATRPDTIIQTEEPPTVIQSENITTENIETANTNDILNNKENEK